MDIYANFFNLPIIVPDKLKKGSKTEQAGYIPAKVQIESLILAGKRLENFRKAVYDTYDPENFNTMNPLRSKDLDISHISQLQNDVEQSMINSLKIAKQKKDDEKKALESLKDDKNDNSKNN